MAIISSQRSIAAYIAAFAVVIVCVAFSIRIYADPVTRLSGMVDLGDLKQYHDVPNFKIGGTYEFGNPSAYEFGGEGGVTLESLGTEPLRLAYIVVGTPKRDSDGNIINAVIVSPYYSGDSTYMYYFWYEDQGGNAFAQGSIVGPGKLIDTNEYFVVFLDALGLWGASKPSDGLGLRFPHYSVLDQVQANYRLLRDKLGVARVKLAIGISMGAFQTYAWAILHPDYVEAIMPIGGATERDPVLGWLFQLMTAAMKSDPAWQKTNGNYYHLPKEQHPNRGMMFGWSILGQTGLSFDHLNSQNWGEVEKEIFYWQPIRDQGVKLLSRAEDFDVNDLLYRNHSIQILDFTDQLHRIKARTLILHVANDQWLRLSQAERAAQEIAGARLATFVSPLAHYGHFRAPNKLKDKITVFFNKIGMK